MFKALRAVDSDRGPTSTRLIFPSLAIITGYEILPYTLALISSAILSELHATN